MFVHASPLTCLGSETLNCPHLALTSSGKGCSQFTGSKKGTKYEAVQSRSGQSSTKPLQVVRRGFLEIYFVLLVIWFGRGMVMAVETSSIEQKGINLRSLRRLLVRSCSAKVVCMEPLLEGPSHDLCDPLSNEATKESRWKLGKNWIPWRHQNYSDLKLLLDVLGCPLTPVAVLSAHPHLPISLKNVSMDESKIKFKEGRLLVFLRRGRINIQRESDISSEVTLDEG
ncbi:hypothetical protein SUGI_0365750 [Cryptomeria japonica]|nr:hypothetical protein SUGI_0365750 [Cryptomeria japonica]